MSTTVTYKGNTIGTATNNTVTLATAGTWMEADVVITDVSSGGATTTDYYVQDWGGGYIAFVNSLSEIDTQTAFRIFKVVPDSYEIILYDKTITSAMWQYNSAYDAYVYHGFQSYNVALTYGDTYRVTWDGYSAIMTPAYDSLNVLYLGSLLADDRPDRNPTYEFEIQFISDTYWYIWCMNDSQHEITIEHLVV